MLKRAPVPVFDLLIRPFTNKRRYRCRECGWTGWKHRLRRRNSQPLTLRRQDSVEPRAAWFFVAVVLFLIIVSILLYRTWNASRPIDVPTGAGLGTPA